MILWGKTDAGKAIPLDAEPSDNGNVVFVDNERVRILKSTELSTARRYTSHFATCPNAKQHRRR